MSLDFVAQPNATFRTGDFLKQSLADPRWTEFRAAVAFVKRSGTKHIRDSLKAFRKRGGIVKISAGVDAGGTSAEGLYDLMEAVQSRGGVFIFKNANSSTFHPKVFLFKNDTAAEVLVGSGNLTEGGLFTNYEASFRLFLNLTTARDLELLSAIVQALDAWSTPTDGLCYPLDAGLLEQLVLNGNVPDEVRARGDENIATDDPNTHQPKLFARHPVRPAPRVSTSAASPPEHLEHPDEPDDESVEVVTLPPVPGQPGAYKAFIMTLQRTDVGIGQITKGASRRSPEIFIPLIARDYDPHFWGWPDLFKRDPTWMGPTDRDGLGKMDRPGVMFRLGGATVPVHMWYNPDKKDLRLRSEHMRSAGAIGDILYIERGDGKGGFTYYVDVVPQSSPRHAELLAICTNSVRNSKKVFGYR